MLTYNNLEQLWRIDSINSKLTRVPHTYESVAIGEGDPPSSSDIASTIANGLSAVNGLSDETNLKQFNGDSTLGAKYGQTSLLFTEAQKHKRKKSKNI